MERHAVRGRHRHERLGGCEVLLPHVDRHRARGEAGEALEGAAHLALARRERRVDGRVLRIVGGVQGRDGRQRVARVDERAVVRAVGVGDGVGGRRRDRDLARPGGIGAVPGGEHGLLRAREPATARRALAVDEEGTGLVELEPERVVLQPAAATAARPHVGRDHVLILRVEVRVVHVHRHVALPRVRLGRRRGGRRRRLAVGLRLRRHEALRVVGEPVGARALGGRERRQAAATEVVQEAVGVAREVGVTGLLAAVIHHRLTRLAVGGARRVEGRVAPRHREGVALVVGLARRRARRARGDRDLRVARSFIFGRLLSARARRRGGVKRERESRRR